MSWLVRTAVLYALWLALVDNIHSAELIAGVPAAMIGAALWTLAARRAPDRLRLRPWMLRRAPAQLAGLVTETLRVAGVLARALTGRPPAGRFRATPFAVSREDMRATRAALTEALGSLAPNRYVIGIDEDRQALLVHELTPSEKPLDPLGLG